MESHLLSYKQSHIHYLKFGRGTRFLFCFHGYGEESFSFRFLERALGADYTLIAIDFPYHGNTTWNENKDFTPGDLEAVINSIVPLELQAISMLGYSMGGRLALAMLQHIPSRIDRVVLIAPDGLHKNFWYWLSTQTSWGNQLFSYTMRKPHWFFRGMVLLKKIGAINKSIFKFAHAYLDDESERHLLYNRWTVMRRFRPSEELLHAVLAKHNTPIRMLFGSYDRIILSERSAALNRQHPTVVVKTIKAGHQLLKEKYSRDIAALFIE